jgi:hypothetical protein
MHTAISKKKADKEKRHCLPSANCYFLIRDFQPDDTPRSFTAIARPPTAIDLALMAYPPPSVFITHSITGKSLT